MARLINSPVCKLISAGGTEFSIHAEILREKSSALRAELDHITDRSASTEPPVLRLLETDSPEIVDAFVKWLYSGEYECVRPLPPGEPNRKL